MALDIQKKGGIENEIKILKWIDIQIHHIEILYQQRGVYVWTRVVEEISSGVVDGYDTFGGN